MKSAWDIAPFLQSEGAYTGEVLRIRSLETISGAQILLRLDGSEIPDIPDKSVELERLETRLKVASADDPDGILSAISKIMNAEQKEIQDGTGTIKITVFYDGWKYADDTDTSDETDIETLVRQLTPGTKITFRTSKNWRNNKIYCRYIKDHSTGFYSGYENEATWKKENRTYDFIQTPGVYPVTILSATPFIDDFERANLLLEICINTDTTFARYCCIAPSSSTTYKLIQDIDSKLLHLKYLAEALEEHKGEDLTLSQLFKYARKKWKRPDLMLRERHAAKQLFDLIERKHLSDFLHPEQLEPGPIPEYKTFKVVQEEAQPEPRYEAPDDDDLSWVYHEDYEGPLDI